MSAHPNAAMYDAATADLTVEQRRMVDAFLVGWLRQCVTTDQMRQALDAAASFIAPATAVDTGAAVAARLKSIREATR